MPPVSACAWPAGRPAQGSAAQEVLAGSKLQRFRSSRACSGAVLPAVAQPAGHHSCARAHHARRPGLGSAQQAAACPAQPPSAFAMNS